MPLLKPRTKQTDSSPSLNTHSRSAYISAPIQVSQNHFEMPDRLPATSRSFHNPSAQRERERAASAQSGMTYGSYNPASAKQYAGRQDSVASSVMSQRSLSSTQPNLTPTSTVPSSVPGSAAATQAAAIDKERAETAPFKDVSEYPDLAVSFSANEIEVIRKSWSAMKDESSTQDRAAVHGTASAFFCQQFYENLLGEFPELKVLFPSIKSQASSMAGILSLVISQLDNLPRVTDILTSLGKRHSRIIGVEVEHYELVGNALLRTLQDRSGENFTIDLENAWIKLYSYIANLMLQAGEDPPMQQQNIFPSLTPTTSGSSDSTSVSSKRGATKAAPTVAPPQAVANSTTLGKGYNPNTSYIQQQPKSKKKLKRSKDEQCSIM